MSAPFDNALREALRLLAALGMPILLAVLAAGLLAAVLQGVTRVRDRSISVAPRLLAVGLVVALIGGWCGARLVGFCGQMFHAAEAAGRPSAAASPPRP